EASEKLLLGPCEDQTPVLDAGDADDTARFEGPPDFDQRVQGAVEGLEHRVAEAPVEVVAGKVERFHAAYSELHILDLVLGSPTACLRELLFGQIDTDHAAGGLSETERDRPLAAADVENEGLISQIRKEKVRVALGTSVLQRLVEWGAQTMIGTVPPSALHAEPVT